MKKYLYFILLIKISYAQISYNFTALSGAFSALSGSGITTVHSAGADDAISAVVTLPFTFYYGCQPYTTCQISTNGVMFLGTTAAGSNLTNDLTGSTDRPAIAPLWDDLAVGTGGSVRYETTGAAPNRVFTIEWLNMEWNYAATSAVISFQVKLYETSNRIEFIYRQESAGVNNGSASIGISGPTNGDFYSLDGTGASPLASKTVETTNLNTKPATGQIYRWDSQTCSGTPSGFTANGFPTNNCAAYITTLSLTGGSGGCGITYQWQSASNINGPYTTFSTTPTATFNVTSTTYFRCVITCTNSGGSMNTNTVTASINPGTPCVCDLIQIPSLPYNSGNVTTCGTNNNVTSANVTNVCGSTNYYGGEDAVYSFTPTSSGQVQISLTSGGSYTGLMLYNGCPLTGGTCVANSQSSTGNKQLCVTVTAGTTYYLVIDSWPPPNCNPYSLSISLLSSASCNMNYTPSSVTYSFETFTGTALPMTDDVLFNTSISFGFPFCFDGLAYSTGYPAANSSLVFDAVACFPNIETSTYAAPGVWTGYSITSAAPVFGTSIPRNAVLGPWHDINPASSATVATSRIQYATFGVAPNRRTVISWEDIPYFSCNSSLLPYFSGQIKIFENGDIEIHIKNKHVCASWNGGDAVLGLHNYDGTIYIPPVNATAHNYPTDWTMTNTAYKFTYNCSGCSILPIGFKSFYGERIQKVNHIYWETSEERNLMSYEILRSNDGIHFETIGAQNPNNTPSKYHFEDKTAPLGKVSYYKIKAIEYDGKVNETRIIDIYAQMSEVFVTNIFPNPITDEVNITIESRLTTTDGIVKVNVQNVLGKQVMSEEIKLLGGINNYKINTSDLQQGVYVFEVIVNEKEKVIQKIIKQ